MFLTISNVMSAPIIDPFIALIPERPLVQINNNIYLIPKTSKIVLQNHNDTINTLYTEPM